MITWTVEESRGWRPLEETYSFVRASLLEREREGSHLSYEQMAAYVDESSGEEERKLVDLHLQACEDCLKEVDDLRGVRAGFFPGQHDGSRGFSVPPGDMAREVWRSGHWVPVAITLAIAMICSLVAVVILQRQSARRQAQLAQLQSANDELRNQLDESKRTVADLQSQLPQIEEPDEEFPATYIALNDADGQVSLDAQGTVTGLGVLGPRDLRLIRQALTTGKVTLPATLKQMVTRPNRTMGPDPNSFSLLSPVGTVVISNQPTFRWEPLNGALSYVVTILDSSFNEVKTSAPLSETEWTATHPLRSGRTYLWQVRAIKDGSEVRAPSPKQGEAKFRVLEHSKAVEVEPMKKTYANSHLVMGVIYADAGLLDDAIREFEALAAANSQSRIVSSLIRSLKRRPAM